MRITNKQDVFSSYTVHNIQPKLLTAVQYVYHINLNFTYRNGDCHFEKLTDKVNNDFTEWITLNRIKATARTDENRVNIHDSLIIKDWLEIYYWRRKEELNNSVR